MEQAIRRTAQLGQQWRQGGGRVKGSMLEASGIDTMGYPHLELKVDREELRARAAVAGVRGFEEEESR